MSSPTSRDENDFALAPIIRTEDSDEEEYDSSDEELTEEDRKIAKHEKITAKAISVNTSKMHEKHEQDGQAKSWHGTTTLNETDFDESHFSIAKCYNMFIEESTHGSHPELLLPERDLPDPALLKIKRGSDVFQKVVEDLDEEKKNAAQSESQSGENSISTSEEDINIPNEVDENQDSDTEERPGSKSRFPNIISKWASSSQVESHRSLPNSPSPRRKATSPHPLTKSNSEEGVVNDKKGASSLPHINMKAQANTSKKNFIQANKKGSGNKSLAKKRDTFQRSRSHENLKSDPNEQKSNPNGMAKSGHVKVHVVITAADNPQINIEKVRRKSSPAPPTFKQTQSRRSSAGKVNSKLISVDNLNTGDSEMRPRSRSFSGEKLKPQQNTPLLTANLKNEAAPDDQQFRKRSSSFSIGQRRVRWIENDAVYATQEHQPLPLAVYPRHSILKESKTHYYNEAPVCFVVTHQDDYDDVDKKPTSIFEGGKPHPLSPGKRGVAERVKVSSPVNGAQGVTSPAQTKKTTPLVIQKRDVKRSISPNLEINKVVIN